VASLVPSERIENLIFLLRGHRVMLDADLAELYGVETKALNRAFVRNRERFPDDFVFQLTENEFEDLRRQIGTSRWGGRRYLPYAFTEQGVAMLSGVLHSKRAIQVNVEIMRPLFVCANYLPPMLSWLANWRHWRKSTMPSSRGSLTQFGSS